MQIIHEIFAAETPMGELPHTLPWLHNKHVVRIMELLGNARFVGGAVRDGLLGRPTKDIDIATPLLPATVIHLLQDAYEVKPIGLRHGSVAIFLPHGYQVEITTLRRDLSSDGRHADVEFTSSWHEDSGRRDFTINAMYADSAGRVYDYREGMPDLANGVVRFIGRPDDRIQEDYLRILRYFRFLSLYGRHKPDSGTLLACRRHVAGLPQLAAARIAQEIAKILATDQAAETAKLMMDFEVLPAIWPTVSTAAVPALRQLVFIETGGIIHPLVDSDVIRRMALLGPAPSWLLKKDDVAKLTNMRANTARSLLEILFTDGQRAAVDRVLLHWAAARDSGRCDNAQYIQCLDFLAHTPALTSPITAAGFRHLQGKNLGDALRTARAHWFKDNESALLRAHPYLTIIS
jgi:poly(A) polymerase